MSVTENKKPVSEENLSTCTSFPDTEISKSTSDNTSSLPTGSPGGDLEPVILPAYGHNPNIPSASVALTIRGIPPKSLNSGVTPKKNTDDVHPTEEVIKRGRHVVS